MNTASFCHFALCVLSLHHVIRLTDVIRSLVALCYTIVISCRYGLGNSNNADLWSVLILMTAMNVLAENFGSNIIVTPYFFFEAG